MKVIPVIRFPRNLIGKKAFTLPEMLLSGGLLCMLAVLFVGTASFCMQKGALAKETAAGKNLIAAYALYAADHDGKYLPGMDYTVTSVWFAPWNKNITTIHASNRYPFRLAPYFDYQLNGIILVNNLDKQIQNLMSSMYDYGVSAFPTFGINYNFMGGCIARNSDGSGNLQFPNECVIRQGGFSRSLLVFASGGITQDGIHVMGYNILTPPNLNETQWSPQSWTNASNPADYGNVDARYDGKAVCVFLDGSVRSESIDDLRDMRLWSCNANIQNNPNYKIPY